MCVAWIESRTGTIRLPTTGSNSWPAPTLPAPPPHGRGRVLALLLHPPRVAYPAPSTRGRGSTSPSSSPPTRKVLTLLLLSSSCQAASPSARSCPRPSGSSPTFCRGCSACALPRSSARHAGSAALPPPEPLPRAVVPELVGDPQTLIA